MVPEFSKNVMQTNDKTSSMGLIWQNRLVARRIADDLAWGVGIIQPQSGLESEQSQLELTSAVLDSIEEVSAAERPYSSCTDGRTPVRLLSGEPVPVREQLVGADTMLFFHMAEAVGPRFYRDPNAPLPERIKTVVEFLHDNGLLPSTHVACGAAGGYVAINRNLLRFTSLPQFTARQKLLLPEGIYSDEARRELVKGYEDRLDRDAYAGWSDAVILEAVRRVSGDHAVAELNDDGRGVHGHVEEQIVRVKLEGAAINEAVVVQRTGGREVFGVNDARMERLARLLGRGRDEDYRLALMAAEDFTDGAHGTLAKGLSTYVVEAAFLS